MKNYLKNYFKTLKDSLYGNKIVVCSFYLMLSIIAIYTLNTPIEKVLATYIALDIIAMFVMVGVLTYYKTNYLNNGFSKPSLILPEGFKYIMVAGLIYSLMFFASNYETYGVWAFIFNTLIIGLFGTAFILKLRSYRKMYMPLFKKSSTTDKDFKSFYLFDGYDDLYFEYICSNSYEFELVGVEKSGMKVGKNYIYINEKPCSKNHYVNYMRENDIKTLEALTEEDRLLIEMINIK